MKKIFYTMICGMLSLTAGAQSRQLQGLSASANQQLLEQAVADGLLVVRRYYQLKDTTVEPPAYYGWNNQPHFGESLSLGVKGDSGRCLLSESAVHPWLYDPKFDQYRNQNRYVPALFKAEYRLLDSAAYRPVVLEDSAVPLSDNRLYTAVADSAFGSSGFTVDRDSGEKNGWLVWVLANAPLTGNATQPLSLIVYRSPLTFTDDLTLYEVRTLSTEKTILGGIYILPQITGIGQITVKLSGVLLEENEKWHVVKVAALPLSAPAGGSGELTPATNEKLER
ncbi:MAG: hypothetical protein LBS12_00995 [Prevotellaceae bacterium]|nr:hypothetical protein [Prevotellaceae bacterium]